MPTAPSRAPAGLLDRTAERSRHALGERLEQLRRSWLSLGLAALAAALSWLLATEAFGRREAFFAPVAAILTLGLTVGQRGRRAFEIGLGVALGIGVADLLVLVIGDGVWQLAVVVALAMAVAVLAGGGALLVNQAAVSGALVVTLQTAPESFSATRFADALLGSAVALLANALIPADPMRIVRTAAEPLLAELAATLEQIAGALDAQDASAARLAAARARELDPLIARLREALEAGHETTVLAPSRRRARGGLAPYATAVTQIEHAVRNTSVLARRVASAIEKGDRVPPSAIEGMRRLAEAIPSLTAYLASPDEVTEVERSVTEAAAHATAALELTGNLSANVIVGQLRAVAVDLLGVAGAEADEAREAVREARGRLGI